MVSAARNSKAPRKIVTARHLHAPYRGMAAAILFASFCAATPALRAASFLGVDLPPPLAAKNVVDTHWNTPVEDPYRFLDRKSVV